MINNITSTSPFIQVSGNSGSMPWMNSTLLSAGQIRYNPGASRLEVYDGNSWQQLGGGYYNIGLTAEAEKIIRWAEGKMQEEQQLKELMKKHPGLQDAYERLEIVKALTLEEEKKHD